MALITVTGVPGQNKVTVGPLAVAATDTVAASDIGTTGVLLNVINGAGSSITVTISDPATTPVGNAGTTTAQTVANATDGWFRILPGHVNPSTGVATITYSSITTITYKAIKA
jgi:hypothetical protein